MKRKKHPFFRKNKTMKYFLLVHLAISLVFVISQFVHGCIEGNPLKSIAEPFENLKALYNPEKYLQNDLFVIDTVFTEQGKSSGTSASRCAYTTIKGHLKDSKTQKQIACQNDYLTNAYNTKYALADNTISLVCHKKNKPIKVLKNKLNDEIFLNNEKLLQSERNNAIIGLYFQISLILLIIQLLILKKESKTE